MRHVVEDLIAEPLPDDLRRHLPGPESRHARRLAVIAGDLVDFGVDHRARDLEDEVLLGLADVYEFSLHEMASGPQGFWLQGFGTSELRRPRFTVQV